MRNSDDPKIMILGDSQGNHIFPGLAFTRPPMQILWAGSCLPLENVELRVARNQTKNPCEHVDYWALQKRILEENPNIRTVIISARWGYIMQPTIKTPSEREIWGSNKLVSSIPGEENLSRSELVRHGLTRVIDYLKSRGTKIIFVGPTPEIDKELGEVCDLSGDVIKDCAIPLADYKAQRKDDDALAEFLKQKYPDIKIYDPQNAFCDATQCYMAKYGQLLFRDHHHLSVAGSLYLGTQIKAWMGKEGLLPAP